MNLKFIYSVLLAIALFIASNSFAQVPDGSTGMCKDGTYTTSASKKGACTGHKGVKEWYATDAVPAAATPPATKKPTKTAAAPKESAPIPDGSTGMCKDGTYTTSASKKGACTGHKGVKEWYATDATPVAAPVNAPEASKKAAPATSKASPAIAPAAQTSQTKEDAVSKRVAPGGGSGKVWVNTDSNVYHCEGGRYYGKTKQGEYMTEAAAKASGARPDHGKACS